MQDFTHWIGIDWSGARGKRHAGLAVACADQKGIIRPVAPPSGYNVWSRLEVASWIAGGCGLPNSARALIGIDSAFSLPFADQGRYLPAIESLKSAPDLWAHIDLVCAEDSAADDYYAGDFVTHYRDHFHLTKGGKGAAYQRRLRVAERQCIDQKMGPCESVYHLIGPSQVGLSGLSTQRMLRYLHPMPSIAVWPFTEPKNEQIVLVEIYAALFAQLGGHRGKIKRFDDLQAISARLDCQVQGAVEMAGEHMADAIVTAAGLRKISNSPKYWKAHRVSPKVAQTEGWIFGVSGEV